jgi:phytoene synthase
MSSIQLYHQTSFACSKNTTQFYSTSFSLGIKVLDKKYQNAIYGIYGMVRVADEIVDTFHIYDKKSLLEKFKQDTHDAIKSNISTNPILQSFQIIVNQYKIPTELIDAFFESMEMDLYDINYDKQLYQKYIYGSAEVVGLMCLKVFCNNDEELYNKLKEPAKALGAAFQKVNFLRDYKEDMNSLGRLYFPNLDFKNISNIDKQLIEKDIEKDFNAALLGIIELPDGAKSGVMLAYQYYVSLFRKIKSTPILKLQEKRISVPNFYKVLLLAKILVQKKANLKPYIIERA